jgi:hypothetical protein
MERQEEGVSGEVSQTTEPIQQSTQIQENRQEADRSSESTEPKRKQSIRSSLRENLRLKSSETEAARPSGQIATQSQEVEAILPPADMTAEEKANWSKLPSDAQKYLARRAYEMRSSFTRKAQEIGARERELNGILEAVSPVQDEYIRSGVSTADVVRRAIAWDKAFKTDPISAARQYLDSYGIDPSELLNGEPIQQQQQGNFSPDEIREQIRQEMLSEFQRREQEQTVHNNYNVVQQFLGSKPLFRDPGTAEQLEAAMAPIVAGLRQSNPELNVNQILEQAYNYVTKGDPQFSSLQQKLEAKAEADRTRAEAEKAMHASRSISGGPGSGTPQRKIKDLRENLRLRYRGAL